MTTITNHTGNTILIHNDTFSAQLCADEKIQINEDTLGDNSELHFCYLDFKGVRRKVERGLEKGGLRKRVYFKYERQSHFPVATVLDIKNISDVTLEAEDVSLRKLLLFRTVYLKRIICKCNPLELEKVRFMFLNDDDKRHFLKLMRFGSIFTIPAALLAMLIVLGELFTNDTIMEKITVAFFLLGFIIVALEDSYYTIKASRWGISHYKEM